VACSGHNIARIKHEIIFAPEAIQDLKRLSARDRTTVRDGIARHLRYTPDKVSRSRIKRLQGMRRPQYRLRIEDFRVYYDIVEQDVEILSIVSKPKAAEWLAIYGETENETSELG
jgi:mRNA-degrading endonuclease RelE of RelBE toxin-antitoxin system